MTWYTDTRDSIQFKNAGHGPADQVKKDFKAGRISLPEAYWRLSISQAMIYAGFQCIPWETFTDAVTSASKSKATDMLPSMLRVSLFDPLLKRLGAGSISANQIRMESIQISMMHAWGYGKGVYDIDTTIGDSVIESSIDSIPQEILERMPYDCLFIPYKVNDCVGVFFHRIVVGSQVGFGFLMVKSGWPFRSATEPDFTAGVVDLDITTNIDSIFANKSASQVSDPATFRAYLNLLLLLCCKNVDIVGRTTSRPGPSFDKRTGSPLVTSDVRHWDVGSRQGAALRASYASQTQTEQIAGHASPRAHVRRAHWHHFWTGPKDSVDRKLALNWVAPVLVGIGETVETHHAVY